MFKTSKKTGTLGSRERPRSATMSLEVSSWAIFLNLNMTQMRSEATLGRWAGYIHCIYPLGPHNPSPRVGNVRRGVRFVCHSPVMAFGIQLPVFYRELYSIWIYLSKGFSVILLMEQCLCIHITVWGNLRYISGKTQTKTARAAPNIPHISVCTVI